MSLRLYPLFLLFIWLKSPATPVLSKYSIISFKSVFHIIYRGQLIPFRDIGANCSHNCSEKGD